MAYEMRENSGSLFKNNKKEKDTHPNAQGEALIGGVLYYVSAWTKKDKNGNPWQSLAFKPKDGGTQKPATTTRSAPPPDDDDDGIPF